MPKRMKPLALAVSAVFAWFVAGGAPAGPRGDTFEADCGRPLGGGATLLAPMSPYDPTDPLLPGELLDCDTRGGNARRVG